MQTKKVVIILKMEVVVSAVAERIGHPVEYGKSSSRYVVEVVVVVGIRSAEQEDEDFRGQIVFRNVHSDPERKKPQPA